MEPGLNPKVAEPQDWLRLQYDLMRLRTALRNLRMQAEVPGASLTHLRADVQVARDHIRELLPVITPPPRPLENLAAARGRQQWQRQMQAAQDLTDLMVQPLDNPARRRPVHLRDLQRLDQAVSLVLVLPPPAPEPMDDSDDPRLDPRRGSGLKIGQRPPAR